MKRVVSCFLVLLLLCAAGTAFPEAQQPSIPLEPYADIREIPWYEGYEGHEYQPDEYDPADIPTFTFNEGTILLGSEQLLAETMERGRNPGLGVRSLHSEGITGEGVRVAIIDQNMLVDHPEFSGKITAYHDMGTDQPADSGSMHGPAVTSLLVGETIGTAPGATVHYAAAPSWTGDSQYYADALAWIISENERLPEGGKIRVVSISAAPSGLPFTENTSAYTEMVRKAQNVGILVLDCSYDPVTGRIAPGFFDPENPDDLSGFTMGFPSSKRDLDDYRIAVPCSYRTVAEQYRAEDTPSYQYTGQGGLSWGIPYLAGVLAMGWQADPSLDNDEIMAILLDTAYRDAHRNAIIDPVSFIRAVQAGV